MIDQKNKISLASLFIFLLVSIFVVVLVISRFFVPILRGSVVTYHSVDRYGGQETTETGRIIALPGESIRFNLQNDQIYIKQGERSYRVIENYLPANTNTFSLAFNDGWYQLASDEVLIVKDSRTIETMLDFVVEDNIIKQSQLIETKKSGKYADFRFIPITEEREFGPKIEAQWMAWQTQVSDHINLKNVATPVVKDGLVYVPMRNNSLVAIDATSGKRVWERSFSSTLNNIAFEMNTNFVTVMTEDKYQHYLEKSTGEIVKQMLTNSNGLDFGIEQSELSLQAEGVAVEKQTHSMVLTKKDDDGKILWRYRSDDLKYFPKYFQQYGQFLVGLGSYGGNSYEDVPLVATIYVFNVVSGDITTKVENLSYVNYEVVGNTLIVFDKILEGFDITNGNKIWSYAISGESGSTSKPWIIDQTRNQVIAADTHQIVALQIQNGEQIWQKKIENSYPNLFVKNEMLYVSDLANSWLSAVELKTGKNLWQVSALGVNQPHITDNNQVHYRGSLTAKLQFTQTLFATLDQTTHQPIPIFNHVTHADNDILIQYEDPYIYVFVDDFVSAIRYQTL